MRCAYLSVHDKFKTQPFHLPPYGHILMFFALCFHTVQLDVGNSGEAESSDIITSIPVRIDRLCKWEGNQVLAVPNGFTKTAKNRDRIINHLPRAPPVAVSAGPTVGPAERRQQKNAGQQTSHAEHAGRHSSSQATAPGYIGDGTKSMSCQ